MNTATTISVDHIWSILANVMDPEVPVLSVTDLGIVRDVSVDNNSVSIAITPTYSGCPAVDVIASMIRMELLSAGFENVIVRQVLSPAWTTDWMSEKGKEKLLAYGIAPPVARQAGDDTKPFAAAPAVACPLCHSYNTYRISEFGSTACKSLYQCNTCKECFDHFKCH